LILPPGAFITLGLLMAGINWFVGRRGEKKDD
jgi:Na+-translocating ferredoxin:NAD+ oxidoreductase RnfE subunit